MTQSSASGDDPTRVLELPLLFVGDDVVLRGMVVPLQLDGERQAPAGAARSAAGETDPARALLVPRLDGRYGTVGATGENVQVGRTPGGEPAAVVRATGRARIGSGVNGPGAALWVEATPIPASPPTDAERALARDVRALIVSIL